MKKTKIAILLTALIMICIFVVNVQAFTIHDESYDEINMVGKYKLSFAVGSNVYGYCQTNPALDFYGDKCNDVVRLPGDNGGRITVKDKDGKLLGWGGNGSSSLLSKPSENATVVRAYLMQQAEVQEGRENVLIDYGMTLKGPKGKSIRPKASKVFVSDRSTNSIGVTYVDVTDFVKEQGFGKYEGWDIPYVTKPKNYSSDDYASWRLIVVCEDADLPIRMLRMKMGSGSTTSKTISLKLDGNGFVTKSTGDVTGQIIIGGGGGDADVVSSCFEIKPSPTSANVRITTGPNGNMNRAEGFLQSIVTENGNIRSDVKTLGYRPSDHTPMHNTDLVLMDVNSTQSSIKNGHNAYFVNNSEQITLSAITGNGKRGNLDLFGILADIDTATYQATLSHSGALYHNSDITMKAVFTNNTKVNKANLGISGGYAQITVDENIALDTNKLSAVYTHNGVKTTLPKSMITVNGNKITVKFGADSSGKSYRGDTLEVLFHGSTIKESLTLKNKAVLYAPNWIDETGTIRPFNSVTTMATATDSILIGYNNPPVLSTVVRRFYEGQYSVEQWLNEIRMSDISADDKEDGNLTDKIKVTGDNVEPLKAGNYTVNYQVEDAYGKITEKTARVNVLYNNPPTINANDRVFYQDELTMDEWQQIRMRNVSANDIEDGDLTSNIKIIKDEVLPYLPGIYPVEYSVTDRFGKTTIKHTNVTITYNHPPTIQAENQLYYLGDLTQNEWENQLRDQIATADDNEDGNITDSIQIVWDDTDVSVPGMYHVMYEVTDRFGKKAEKQITVEIRYNQIPQITADNITIYENEISSAVLSERLKQNASAYDAEDGDLSDQIRIISNNVDTRTPGNYEVTYEVIDSKGAVGIKTIDVTVLENREPILQLFTTNKRFIEGQYTQSEWEANLRMKGVSAYDKEDRDLTDQIQIINDTTNPQKQGSYEVTYKVTDRFGKSAEKTAKVTVEPNEAPIIYANDKYFTTNDQITDQQLLKNVYASDDHDTDINKRITIKTNNVEIGKAGSYEVTYEVIDSLGKKGEKTITVSIKEAQEAPITPPIPEDMEVLYWWNGKQQGAVNITKLMEQSEFGHDKDALKDVVFGVYAKEDIIYQNRVVLQAGSLVAITKADTNGRLQAIIHHKGKYFLKELSTNNNYILDEKEYEFEFK